MQICKYLNICMCSSDHPPPVSTGCGLQIIYKYLNIWIFVYMQICKYLNIGMWSSDHPPPVSTGCGLQIIYKYLNICIYANMQIFKYSYAIWPPSPCVYWSGYLNICKYANIQIFVCYIWPPSPVSADSECNRIKDEYLNIFKNLNICILSGICKPVTHKTSAHHTPIPDLLSCHWTLKYIDIVIENSLSLMERMSRISTSMSTWTAPSGMGDSSFW